MLEFLKNLFPQGLKNWFHFVIAMLSAVYFRFPAKRLKVIGVTGTDGKTTTATIIYHILRSDKKKVALISTVAAKIGSREIDTGFHVTSPDPWSLQKLVYEIFNKGYDYLVLEATSHGLDQHRLFGVDIYIGVLTNITHEHIDYHKTYSRYVQAKSKLFRNCKYVVLNKDDGSYKKVLDFVSSNTRIRSYSIELADKKVLSLIKKRFPQRFNQSNALAAVEVARILDIDPKVFLEAILSCPNIKGRMDIVSTSKGITAIVDFAHTPNALEQVLLALKDYRECKNKKKIQRKIIAVYGSAGLRDGQKRPVMGEIGSRLADVVVFTAEDPRTEDVNEIIAQMRKGATGKAKIYIEPDRQKAIDLAVVELAEKGDIVAIFGKGHETSMCFGKIEYPWSDHDAIKKALKKRR